MKLALIPQPHKLVIDKGVFRIPASGTIAISDSSLYPVAEQAKALFKRYAVNTGIRRIADPVRISLRKGLKAGGYRLTISGEAVGLEAESPTAAFHGLQTLLQIASQCPVGRLPQLRIDDWPDLQDRGVYYDVCRGRVPKLARLMEQVAVLSHFKINQYQLYIEHTFKFRGHPLIGKGASPLSAEDVLVLDAWCREFQVELVPSLASFGHLSPVLSIPKYHDLAEDWGIGKYTHPENKHWGAKGWSLSPANPKVYSFLDSLYSEFLPVFSSKRFNVCCDETWDLGWGQTYDLCKKLGKGKVYLNHIVKLNRLCRKYGKKIMFWGDIIRHYPKLIKDIPKDALVLDWGYGFNHPFDRIRDFKKAGLDFYACPGTSSWVSLFPRLYEAMANIHGFAAAAKKNKGRGLLNTDWGDGGHYNFMEYSWHGFLFGAEQAWNVDADQATFTARFAKLFFGTDDPALVRAIDTLGEVTHLNAGYYQSIWQHIFFAGPGHDVFNGKRRDGSVCRNGKIRLDKVTLDAKLGRDTLKRLETVRKVLLATAQRSGTDPHGVLPYWIFAVDTIAHAAKKLTVLGAGGRNTAASRKALKAEMTSLKRQFEKLWMARNRPSEIRVTLKRYQAVINALGK